MKHNWTRYVRTLPFFPLLTTHYFSTFFYLHSAQYFVNDICSKLRGTGTHNIDTRNESKNSFQFTLQSITLWDYQLQEKKTMCRFIHSETLKTEPFFPFGNTENRIIFFSSGNIKTEFFLSFGCIIKGMLCGKCNFKSTQGVTE